jgi:hypothetical protein
VVEQPLSQQEARVPHVAASASLKQVGRHVHRQQPSAVMRLLLLLLLLAAFVLKLAFPLLM